MTDDVRLAVGLRHHRKTKRLRRALGAEGCWSLVCLFLWVGDERWTGDLSGLSDEDIEEEADWRGEPGMLVRELVSVGFLVGKANARKIHQWAEHNPYAAAKGERIEKGRVAAVARWEKERRGKNQGAGKASHDATSDATSMPGACPEHATRSAEHCPPAPAPTPAPSDGVSDITTHPSHAQARASAVQRPEVACAIALNKAGFRVTAANPELVAYAQSGGTPAHLVQLAAMPNSAGKGAGYVIAWARRELTAAANPIDTGEPHAIRRDAGESPATRARKEIADAARRAGVDLG